MAVLIVCQKRSLAKPGRIRTAPAAGRNPVGVAAIVSGGKRPFVGCVMPGSLEESMVHRRVLLSQAACATAALEEPEAEVPRLGRLQALEALGRGSPVAVFSSQARWALASG